MPPGHMFSRTSIGFIYFLLVVAFSIIASIVLGNLFDTLGVDTPKTVRISIVILDIIYFVFFRICHKPRTPSLGLKLLTAVVIVTSLLMLGFSLFLPMVPT